MVVWQVIQICIERHDERSLFDGFGKPQELVKIAKNLGYEALGITNHGDLSSLVSHYYACKDIGIKPIMGCEGYFLPKWNEENKKRGYHLNLWVKTLKGYQNLNRIHTKAGKNQYYYNPIWTFDLLEKYHDGLMCGSACIGGPLSQLLINNKDGIAYKVAEKFIDIFGDDFYIEIMPYALSEKSLQEKCNNKLMKLAKDLKIKCIMTSDSHFGSKDDFDTYLKMHEIGGHLELGKEYSERYMPSEKEIINRFVNMHGGDFGDTKIEAKRFAENCIKNIEGLVNKVDDVILENLELVMPHLDDEDSSELLWKNIVKGLKEKDKWNKEYKNRAKEEYDVICYHGFEDYFLMVQDYVRWAKENGIEVGPGRGSVCNCLVAYALDITEVDSILFDLDFRRFLRKDKKKLPDVDMDFETDFRGDVINYLIDKYKGHAARICSYGLYKVDNCLNDLFKVCGLALPSKKDEDFDQDKYDEVLSTQKEIKNLIAGYVDPDSGDFDYESALKNQEIKELNKKYDNIIKHFSKLYKKVRFYGTHAAGVAITGAALNKYTAIERRAKNTFTTSYDLIDIEQINGIKFDMLGLRTMSILKELRSLCGRPHHFCEEYLYDDEIYEQFEAGNTDGIFQFESAGGKGVLREIEANSYNDIVAASALNRPGPLGLGMPEQYANAKKGISDTDKEEKEIKEVFDKYASDSYGCFVYQEQVMKICHYAAGMEWADADKIMKMMKNNKTMTEKALKAYNEEHDRLQELFINGATNNGYSKKAAKQIFDKLNVYTFNKGHAVGYALISIEQMWYKVHYPIQFWYITLKYAKEQDYWKLVSKAVKDGCVILLPHVNGTAQHSLREIDGELAIQEGTSLVKNVGLKAAEFIEQEIEEGGPFRNYGDFEDRIVPYKRVVNKRVLDALQEAGALEFDEKKYFKRVKMYNSSLYSR